MIQNDDNIERFLICTPFSSNNIFTYNGELTEELFFSDLYVPCKKSEKTDEKIKRNILYNTKNTIFVLGNKGCGKTTFINKIKKDIISDSRLEYLLIDFGESNSTLECESAKEILGKKIYKILKDYITKSENIAFGNEFINLYLRNEEEFDSELDKNKKIDHFFRLLRDIIQDTENSIIERYRKEVRSILFNMEIYQLFVLLTLCLLHKQMYINKEIKHTAIILDNLDNMLSIKEIKSFVHNYNNFVNAIGRLINHISENENKDYKYLYTYILVMREITKANISSPHFMEENRLASVEYDITNEYSKKEIGMRRTEYLLELYQKIKENKKEYSSEKEGIYKMTSNQAYQIQNIIKDIYIQKTIFPLYNNDYRVAMLSLVKLCGKNDKYISEYINLMKFNLEGAKYGGRGIIYRLVLNQFRTKEYFKRIGIVDFQNRTDKKVSLARLLLTYLNNTTSIDSTNESPAVSLKELFKAFSRFHKHEIIDCLWEMYNLIISDEWNHLITFSSSNQVSKEGLYNEKRIYEEGRGDDVDEYSMFRITCAGRIYLTNICTHFEFFSCRAFGNSCPPLFSEECFQIKNDEYIYWKILKKVYEEVEQCCKDLLESVEAKGQICYDVHSNFNFRKENDVAQYHSERIIFSHIGYLDTFRCFYLGKGISVLERNNINIQEFAEKVLDRIEQYIILIEKDNAVCSSMGRKTISAIKSKFKEAQKNILDSTLTINLQVGDGF